MENYNFKKYYKYKFKYLKLKKQIAGSEKGEVYRINKQNKDTAENLSKQLKKVNITEKLKEFYDKRIEINNQVFLN